MRNTCIGLVGTDINFTFIRTSTGNATLAKHPMAGGAQAVWPWQSRRLLRNDGELPVRSRLHFRPVMHVPLRDKLYLKRAHCDVVTPFPASIYGSSCCDGDGMWRDEQTRVYDSPLERDGSSTSNGGGEEMWFYRGGERVILQGCEKSRNVLKCLSLLLT